MALVVTNNSPSAGYIRWTGLHIVYQGIDHTITDGSTNKRFVWWQPSISSTVLQTGDSLPNLGDDDLLVFLNKNGIHVTVPKSTVVDGSLIVSESILADALAANSVTTAKIAAGAVDTAQLAADAVTAANIAAGAVEAQAIAAGAVGAQAIAARAVVADKIAVATLDAISEDVGTLSAGVLQDKATSPNAAIRLDSGSGLPSVSRYIDLAASGSDPFLKHEEVELRADGSAYFGGTRALAAAKAQGGLFLETFEQLPDSWIKQTGSGTLSIAAGQGATGGTALRADGYMWKFFPVNIPFDPSKLYRIRARVQQLSRNSGGHASTFIGVCGVGADGVTFVNTSGQNSSSSQHYNCMSDVQVPVDGVYHEYTGWFKGWGTSGQSGQHTATAPGKIHQDVRYIRPLFILNYSDGAGSSLLDEIAIDVFDEDGTTRTYLGLDGSGTVQPGKVIASSIDVDTLDAISANVGVLSAGRLQDKATNPTAAIRLDSGSALPAVDHYLDLAATGSNPFLKHGTIELRADGTGIIDGRAPGTLSSASSENRLENPDFEVSPPAGSGDLCAGWFVQTNDDPALFTPTWENQPLQAFTGTHDIYVSVVANKSVPANTTRHCTFTSRRFAVARPGEVLRWRMKYTAQQNIGIPAGLSASLKVWARVEYSDGSVWDSPGISTSAIVYPHVELTEGFTVPAGSSNFVKVNGVRLWFWVEVKNTTGSAINTPNGLMFDVRFDAAQLVAVVPDQRQLNMITTGNRNSIQVNAAGQPITVLTSVDAGPALGARVDIADHYLKMGWGTLHYGSYSLFTDHSVTLHFYIDDPTMSGFPGPNPPYQWALNEADIFGNSARYYVGTITTAASGGGGTGGSGGGGCFVGDTRVVMADGSRKPIRDVRVGDLVLAMGPDENLRPRRVLATMAHGDVEELLDLAVEDTILTTTPCHRFYVGHGEYRAARTLERGDTLYAAYCGSVRPTEVYAVRTRRENVPVYNLTVEDDHTYLVEGVVVHNIKLQ